MTPRPKHGEVWIADLGLAGKTRPVVIVSRTDADPPRALAIYVPITTQARSSDYEVALGHLSFLDPASVANVQGIGSLPLVRLEKRIGTLPEADLSRVKAALQWACDLD
jgi:mRNA interferase MazF